MLGKLLASVARVQPVCEAEGSTAPHRTVLINPCERVADHVADVVKACLDASLVERMQPVNHIGPGVKSETAQLDVLPSGDVDDTNVGPEGLD